MKTLKLLLEEKTISIDVDGKVEIFERPNATDKEIISQIKDAHPDCNVEVEKIESVKAEPIASIIDETKFKDRMRNFMDDKKRKEYENLYKLYGDKVKKRDYPKVRRWFQRSNTASLVVGAGTGLVFGKTFFTGLAIGTGTYVVASIASAGFIEYKIKQLNK